MKIIKIIIIAIIITLIGSIFLKTLAPRDKKYNLILISVDTLRADHMGVYDYSKNTTPNIDKWAKNATVFTNAYTIFPLTFQSFYTLFTGRNDVLMDPTFAHSHSVTEVVKPLSATLPQILKGEGFTTAALVTNPVIEGLSKKTFREGFDVFNFYDATGLSKDINIDNAEKRFNVIFARDNENSEKLTKDAVAFLKNRPQGRFFLWLHYTTPHEPYNPPQEEACKFNSDLCNEQTYSEALNIGAPRCNDNIVPSQKQISLNKGLYDTEISLNDEQIGKVLDKIKQLELDKNSIIVFYSDHGESFEHGVYSHGYSLYSEEVHIPLIISIPDKGGVRKNILLDNSDILPTLLDLLKVNYNKSDFSGESFLSSFDKVIDGKDYVFFKTPADWTERYGVTDGKYKYTYSDSNFCDMEVEQLFDLSKDKAENKNIVKGNSSKREEFFRMTSDFFDLDQKQNTEVEDPIKHLGY